MGALYTVCVCPGYRSMCNILIGLWVMFSEFGAGYGSALQRFVLVMGNC